MPPRAQTASSAHNTRRDFRRLIAAQPRLWGGRLQPGEREDGDFAPTATGSHSSKRSCTHATSMLATLEDTAYCSTFEALLAAMHGWQSLIAGLGSG